MSDTTTDGSSNIECYGFQSCMQAQLIQSTGTANIHCMFSLFLFCVFYLYNYILGKYKLNQL